MGTRNGTIQKTASPARTKSAIGNGVAPRRTVMLYPSRKMVEVAPGIKTAQLAQEHVPELAIVKWRAIGDGTYQPVLVIYEPEIRVTEAARTLHVDYKILRRLLNGGFVAGTQPSPGFYQMSLSSWFEHVERVRKDPEFWSRKENMRKYREAL
jgi:hypothetical protein